MSESRTDQLVRWISVERLELGRELKAHRYDRAVGIAHVILNYAEEIRRINATQSQEVAQ